MRLPMKHTESCFSNDLSLPTITQRYHEPVTTLVNQPKNVNNFFSSVRVTFA